MISVSQPPAIKDITHFVKECHKHKKEAWIAGSIKKDELPDLWATDVVTSQKVEVKNGAFPEIVLHFKHHLC